MGLSWEERLKARGSSYTPSSSAIADKAINSQVNVGSKLGAGQSIRHNQQRLAAMHSRDSAANALKIGGTNPLEGGGRAMVNPTGGTNALAESLKRTGQQIANYGSQVGQDLARRLGMDASKEVGKEAAKNIAKETASKSKWASMNKLGKAGMVGNIVAAFMAQVGKGQDQKAQAPGHGSTPSAVHDLEEFIAGG